MLEHLFVYGTLRPGEENFHWLSTIEGSWQPATTTGYFLASGVGPAMGYPGIIFDRKGDIIKGQLFSSLFLAEHWVALDDFEGEGYQRVLAMVQCQSGECFPAYVYQLSELGRPSEN